MAGCTTYGTLRNTRVQRGKSLEVLSKDGHALAELARFDRLGLGQE
jgi:hypothetical protein